MKLGNLSKLLKGVDVSFSREAGKGSAPRKSQDHEKFSEGYDRIFGRNKEKAKESEDQPKKEEK